MIHSIVGLQSSGKTLILTKHLFKDFCKGRDIITNFDVSFPHRKINKDYVTFIAREQPNLMNVSFGFDEFWLWVDSRRAFNNTIISYFGLQTSKGDINLYMTAQDNTQIDIRFRNNLHRLTNCYRCIKVGKKIIPVPQPYDEERILPEEFNDVLYIKTVDFKRTNIGMYTELVPTGVKYHYAKPLFNLFKTRERIQT